MPDRSISARSDAYLSQPRGFAFAMVAVFAGAVALRLAIRLITGTQDYWINGYTMYARLAQSLASGHGYAFPGEAATAFRVPFYPVFIAAISGGPFDPWPLIIAQALVSAGSVVMAGLIARRLFGGTAGLVAALLCAVYPYYVWHDLALQESGLFAFLAALATWLLLVLRDRRSLALAGAIGFVFGLALLTRAMLLPFAGLAIGWLLLRDEAGTPFRSRFLTSAALAGALLLTLAPWLSYQQRVAGSAGLGTENGLSLYRGAHPLLFSRFPAAKVDDSLAVIEAQMPVALKQQRAAHAPGSASESDWYARQAMALIQADPAGYAVRAVRKLAIAFGPRFAPHKGLMTELAYTLSWLPVLALGLTGLWQDRRNWRRNLLFAAHFAAFSAVTAALWAQTSHRSYLDLYLMVFAAPVMLRLLAAACSIQRHQGRDSGAP